MAAARDRRRRGRAPGVVSTAAAAEDDGEEHHLNPFLSDAASSSSRVQFRNVESRARWVELAGAAEVVDSKGKLWLTTGVTQGGKLYYNVEEIGFLAERGALVLLDDEGETIGMEGIYEKIAGGNYGFSWDAFQAYKHLKLLGYIIGRYGVPWTMKHSRTCEITDSPTSMTDTDQSFYGANGVCNDITKLFKEMHIDGIFPSFEVHLPNSKFKKSSPGVPSFLLCLLRDKPPSRDELETVENKFEGIPLKFCHVDNGRINFLSFDKVGLEGSANGQWWIDNIGKTLDEGISFHRVGSRQLAGLLIAAWARKDLKPHVGDIDAAAVPCGFGRAIGNKGGVGLRIRVYDRRICFVNNHFAAHLENVSRRNADFDHIYRTMSFNKPHGSAVSATSVQLHKGVNANGNQPDEDRPELAEADMVVFLGDFNYRLYGITYDEARDMVSQRSFDWLRERDQLQAEMKAGNVFQGMREGFVRFPPTYKFQRHQPGLAGYDSGEKKRIPAWCDRILYRDSRSESIGECSLECPVVAAITSYEACMDVTDSDHKPVRCTFSVNLARVDELIRRREYGKIIESNEKLRCLLEESHCVPDTIISTNNIILENQETVVLRITNDSGTSRAAFEILCEGQSTSKQDGTKSDFVPRASFGFPHWLEVEPSIGLIEPGETMEVTVHHEDFYTQEEFVDGVLQNGWCEVTSDKEAILLVNVTGSTSTETITHRINVRHCCTASSASEPTNQLSVTAPPSDGPTSETPAERSSPKKTQSNHLQRSDFLQFGSSEVHDLCRLRNI